MSTEKNVQTVKDFFAAIGRDDGEGLLALVAEDIEWIIPGEDWPLAGTRHGHAGLADLLETASKTIETSTESQEFVAQGDRVLVLGFARGTVRATNKTFEDHFAFAITVRDGRLTNIREYIDTQALARASEMDASPRRWPVETDTERRGPMSDDVKVLERMYDRFNARDIDGVLTALTEDVVWANGMDGGHVHGREAVRAYWTRQWSTVSPHVEPVGFHRTANGMIVAEVRQTVRDLEGKPLQGQTHGLKDKMVGHVFHLRNGKVARFDIQEAD